MPSSRKAREVAGFQVVRAVKHAKEAGHEPLKAARAEPTAMPPPERKPAARIGHTALPTKHDVVCYQCGYEFTIAGRVQTLYCPKCRTVLEQGDITIESECAESIKTTGIIRLARSAVLNGGDLHARDVVLEGRISAGHVRAYRTLVLGDGAEFDQAAVEGRDLRIAAGSAHRLSAPATFRHVDIAGTLDADLHATGHICVRATGDLHGRIQGAHLTVEEGGGLTADVRIGAS